MNKYVHGYSPRETQRLQEQSEILEELLHSDTFYPTGNRVLEAGCGVGGQTVILARRSPEAEFTCVDISTRSLAEAEAHATREGMRNARFQQADVMRLPFEEESFDHAFVCFLLEHLSHPLEALIELKRVIKEGGTLTLIEGDHGSCFWYPQTAESLKVWGCMIGSQQQLGHDPLIGRRLYPLLKEADFEVEYVSPRWVYADALNPQLRNGMINKIIVPMTRTARETSIDTGMIVTEEWERGIADMASVDTSPEGTFFYTWFKGVAIKRVYF
ncbi:MAG: class I SAM-dependent methyltransferase [Dehalococcoidia bacterium]